MSKRISGSHCLSADIQRSFLKKNKVRTGCKFGRKDHNERDKLAIFAQ